MQALPRMYDRLENCFVCTDGTPGDAGHVEPRFGPFRDSVSVGAT